MQKVIKCPQCNSEITDESIGCRKCASTISRYTIILDYDMIDFMTTGTDPRLAPRSDSG